MKRWSNKLRQWNKIQFLLFYRHLKRHVLIPIKDYFIKQYLTRYQRTFPVDKKLQAQEIEYSRLKKEYEHLFETAHNKSELLANISHELRTPLTSILGYTNLLLDSDPTPYQKDFLNTIQKSSNSMLALINDILDLAKIEAGKLKLDHIPCNVRECVDDVLIALAPQAHNKQLELIAFVYSDVPLLVLTDPLRFKQVIMNLLSNALKFTEEGSVIIRIMVNNETPTDTELHISVTDTGIGLTVEHQKQLFQPYMQTFANSAKLGGTGLGLVICRRIINQMAGDIGVESEIGKGSTFWFTCTVEKIPNYTVDYYKHNKLQKQSVVIYDPYPLSQLALKYLLIGFGMSVTEANDLEHLNLLVKTQNHKNNFALIIIGTNRIEQYKAELKKRLQQIKRYHKHPFILLLNTSEPAIFTEMLTYGISFCMAKPACQSKLYAAMCELLLGEKMSVNNESSPKPMNQQRLMFSKTKVLIADDNPANLKLLRLLLERLGPEVTAVTDGIEAVSMANKMPFDLILLDLQMPNLNGLEAARKIRAHSKSNKKTPIIAITAHILGNEKSNIGEIGINEYLTKPINEIKLSMLLNKWIKKKATHLINHLDSNTTEQQELPEVSFNWAQCIVLAGNKVELAQTLLKMFKEQLPELQAKIKQAYTSNDMTELGEHVHKLHGGCCYCGVPKLKAICSRLETAIKRNDETTIKTLYTLLQQEIIIVMDLMAKANTFEE